MRKLENNELSRLDLNAFKGANKIPVYIILDSVRSHQNVGSVFRTSDAFRIEKIFLCGITGTPPHRDIQKTALGATESVTWEYRENIDELIQELKLLNIYIASIEQAENACFLNAFEIPSEQKLALCLAMKWMALHNQLFQHQLKNGLTSAQTTEAGKGICTSAIVSLFCFLIKKLLLYYNVVGLLNFATSGSSSFAR